MISRIPVEYGQKICWTYTWDPNGYRYYLEQCQQKDISPELQNGSFSDI